ncbi:hypothetical protein ABW19_dt0201045 [Dactylella cylindrospora]|nr:hypothetical protein ABW19_dt0201045 [Dactylella cylindrospora]
MPVPIPILFHSKVIGVTTAGILTGTLLTHSITTTPLLLSSPNHEIILKQFRHVSSASSSRTSKRINALTIISSLSFITSAYLRFTHPSCRHIPALRYLISGLLVASVLPYGWLAMRRTEEKLERLYEEEVEGLGFEMRGEEEGVVVKGEVRQLVDWWGVVNLGRVVGAGIGLLVGAGGTF